RSTVLGGAVVEELNNSAQKNTGHVYTPLGTELATQVVGQNYVIWKQLSPLNTTHRGALSTGFSTRVEFDPVGASVRTNPNSPPDHSGGDGDIPGGGDGSLDGRFNSMANPLSSCMLDGVFAPCALALRGEGEVTEAVYVDPFVSLSSRSRRKSPIWIPVDTTRWVETPTELIIYSGPGGYYVWMEDPDDVVEAFTQPVGVPQNPSPEQAASTRAAELLRDNNDCFNFISELMALTADIAIRPFNATPTPDFRPILGPNGLEPSFQPDAALQAYNTALAQGRVTASNRSGRNGNIITYGTTTNHRTIGWNREFYGLALVDQALMTLHESLHLFANFTDFAIADAAHMLASRSTSRAGTRGNFRTQEAASLYINQQIAGHCRP
ncbi:MAG TPA: hypothetical protein VFM05_04700, partial [Candidatus Saccharimonadales bacterium]|nr:hypothetical protein [Candidatus Saccharimonadales bacterium]